MDALIMSCATGGGHHAAARAIREELLRRGHHVEFLDPYTLSGKGMDRKVGDCYVKCAQKAPDMFGMIYRLGNLYRRLPGKSPVYWANRKTAGYMEEYLRQHSFDVILMTHIFPGEILTYLKRKGAVLPKTIYVATDYTCIPFTEEIECDGYVVPSGALKKEFCRRGIPAERAYPLGIPVRRSFREAQTREETAERLGLDPEKRYILIAGGSIGAGKLIGAIRVLHRYLKRQRNTELIVICGSNRKLYDKLERKYRKEDHILLLKKADCMADYLKVCDFYISKPGGISSTEAAVSNTPLIHISPIPGCETKNLEFFTKRGMSLYAANLKKDLPGAIRRIEDRDVLEKMRKAQRKYVDPRAAERIADLAEQLAEGTGDAGKAAKG